MMPKRTKSERKKSKILPNKTRKNTPHKQRLEKLKFIFPKRITSKLKRKKKQKPPRPTTKLTGSFRLFADSLSLLRQHWKVFGGITLIYILLNILLVGALSGSFNFNDMRQSFTEEFGKLTASVALFGVMVSGSTNPTNEQSSIYQTLIILIVSLATIWTLRQILAGEKVQIRDAFYKGMYPLIPLIIVLIYMVILFIPAAIASFLLTVVIGGGLAINALEVTLWSMLIFGLFFWSLYLVTNRLFAVYIVTLPNMRPMAAIKASRKLVYYRRWAIIRKLLFLPSAMLIIGAMILLPIITFTPFLAQWVFLVLSMFALVFAHTYVYSLYKELL